MTNLQYQSSKINVKLLDTNKWLSSKLMGKRLSLHTSQVAHQAGAFLISLSMKQLGIFLLPLDGMLVHRRVTPSIKFASTHFYTWAERGTVTGKCLAREENTMSPARARLLDLETRALTRRLLLHLHKGTRPLSCYWLSSGWKRLWAEVPSHLSPTPESDGIISLAGQFEISATEEVSLQHTRVFQTHSLTSLFTVFPNNLEKG